MNLQDLSSPEFYRDPYPLYEKIRARGKLFNVAPHILMTGHYDMIDAILVEDGQPVEYDQPLFTIV